MQTALPTRRLGRAGIDVGAIGLGCWAIGGPFWRRGGKASGWGEVDDEESVRAIHRSLDLGVTFFDTADVYGAGHSERVLGRALAGRRDQVAIATKFGNTFDESSKNMTGEDTSPAYIRRACEASLRRLGTDRIDLYQLHAGPERDAAPEIVEALEQLVADGLIRAYGWSTDDPERARAFAKGEHCAAAQFNLNVFDDAPGMVTACEENELAGINRGPLAMGLLTGKFTAESRLPSDDVRGSDPEWLRWFENGRPSAEFLERLAAIREILTSEGRTLAQGALAWIHARSEATIPIPGFRTVAQVEENVGALAAGPLSPDRMREIDRLLAR
jgi:aryl-alcohol dehydrogenase-like predicted oxidoreductase